MNTPLITMLITPEAERVLVAELQSRFNVRIDVHLDDAEDDGSLYEQWHREHPDVPVGERRLSTLSADVFAGDAQKITEEVLDIISPTARLENSRVRAGEQVTVAVDAVPWFAHVPLW